MMKPELISLTDRSPEAILALNSIQTLIEDCTNPALVVLTINGQQTSFIQMIKSVIESFEQNVEERAKELVKERTTDKINTIINKLEHLNQSVTNELFDAGFKNVFENSDYWQDS